MKTTADVLNIVYGLVKGSPLEAAISGKLRKGERPAGSDKEDIVITCLPIDNEQLQRCVCNVNIYVPCYRIPENGVQTEGPDFARLEVLAALATTLFKAVRKAGDYQVEWQQQHILKDADSASWYINIRLRFQAFNI